MCQGQNYEHVLPHHTQQYDAGDETKVVYSEVKLTPEVKEEVATQKGKEATQTTEGMQRGEGELADQKEMDEEESECMHVEILPNGALQLTVLLYYFT